MTYIERAIVVQRLNKKLGKDFRKSAIIFKLIKPYLFIGKSHFYQIIKQDFAAFKINETRVETLYQQTLEISKTVLTMRDWK